jgi:S1-C subfamily serine protease
MITMLKLVCLMFSGASLWLAPARPVDPADAAVKVMASVRYPNPLRPWTKGNAVEVAGSGVVIEGRRILTSAHLVLYATEVKIQPRRGGDKVEAHVEAIAPDVDLAVLTLKDDKFFKKHPPLPRAKQLPKVQDTVLVYGFPIGGTDLAVTKGVVSRIGLGEFRHAGAGLLVQVSAAVNPGSSGGPAVVNGQLVGVVFSRLSDGENIGYLVPGEEIDRFLEDIKDGHYDGKPTDVSGSDFQRLENPGLRRFLGLGETETGVLVLPPQEPPAGYPFRPLDVLQKIGPYGVDNEGMVRRPNDLRVSFVSVIPDLAKGNQVPVTVRRGEQRVELSLPVGTRDPRLIRDYQGEMPSYFIYGPLVLSPAKQDAIALYCRLKPSLFAGQCPLVTRSGDLARSPDEELVVVTAPLFAHKVAQGYADPLGQVVSEVNGVKVRNLHHLVKLLRDCKDDYVRFRFADAGSELLVFRRADMEPATAEILDDNGISPARRGSRDMLEVWKKPAGSR